MSGKRIPHIRPRGKGFVRSRPVCFVNWSAQRVSAINSREFIKNNCKSNCLPPRGAPAFPSPSLFSLSLSLFFHTVIPSCVCVCEHFGSLPFWWIFRLTVSTVRSAIACTYKSIIQTNRIERIPCCINRKMRMSRNASRVCVCVCVGSSSAPRSSSN